MDRDAMARNQRRRQVEELLDDERGREAALAERLEEVVAELEGPRLDEQVFARLDPEDVSVVRQALRTAPPFDDGEEDTDAFVITIGDDEPEENWSEDEIARLERELAASRRRQHAFERYLDALDA